ncbi:sigma factor G inhibitor Gin [Effusibacillus consociatus]|uniref:Sigma factor G inhibitor Gin n=1 Tax=Effusibacillus consociatus TaxID=1117041 RepID=A0ABV9Q5F6_9BACL
MSESSQTRVCIVCREPKSEGIRIWEQFVCVSCEREIVQTDVEDEKYPFYIERMKGIWFDMIS